jgi:DNA-binding transcriptional ArsR family regulator
LAVDEVAAAIADPVRRTVLTMLRSGPLTAGSIAAAFPISRPAVSRHLRVLREAGLVVVAAEGRQRRYRLDTTPLGELDGWLAQFRHVWATRLDALETEVHRTRRERREAGAAATTGRRPVPSSRPQEGTA